MHSALFVAMIPPEINDWREFLSRVQKRADVHKGFLRLSENVWLLNFRESPAPLAFLISYAEQLGVSYGVLPFPHEPEWLPVGFDPETILGQSEDR